MSNNDAKRNKPMTRDEIDTRLGELFAELDSLPPTRFGMPANPRKAAIWDEIGELQDALNEGFEYPPFG